MNGFTQMSNTQLDLIDGGAIGGALGFGIIGASIGSLAGGCVAIYHSATGNSSQAWNDVKAGLVTGATVGGCAGSTLPF